MGRSVNYLNNAVVCYYVETDSFADNYRDFIEDVQNIFTDRYPSFNEVDKWQGREVRIIAENDFCSLAVSEYCGLSSISVAVRDDLYYSIPEQLAENWLNRCAGNMSAMLTKCYPNGLSKVGSFSNGESVFERVKNDSNDSET